jgi:transcriptional regulator with XRE-family HTH domain
MDGTVSLSADANAVVNERGGQLSARVSYCQHGAKDRCLPAKAVYDTLFSYQREGVGRMFQKNSNTVGTCIARERKRAGLSQESLAEQLHVTRQTISNWESGRSLPDIESLKALAECLSVPIERLIYEEQKLEQQEPGTLWAAITQDIPLERWCRWLGIFALVWGLITGIREGSGTKQVDANTAAWAFYWSNAFAVWYPAVIRGTILLALSKILTLLTKEKEL